MTTLHETNATARRNAVRLAHEAMTTTDTYADALAALENVDQLPIHATVLEVELAQEMVRLRNQIDQLRYVRQAFHDTHTAVRLGKLEYRLMCLEDGE